MFTNNLGSAAVIAWATLGGPASAQNGVQTEGEIVSPSSVDGRKLPEHASHPCSETDSLLRGVSNLLERYSSAVIESSATREAVPSSDLERLVTISNTLVDYCAKLNNSDHNIVDSGDKLSMYSTAQTGLSIMRANIEPRILAYKTTLKCLEVSKEFNIQSLDTGNNQAKLEAQLSKFYTLRLELGSMFQTIGAMSPTATPASVHLPDRQLVFLPFDSKERLALSNMLRFLSNHATASAQVALFEQPEMIVTPTEQGELRHAMLNNENCIFDRTQFAKLARFAILVGQQDLRHCTDEFFINGVIDGVVRTDPNVSAERLATFTEVFGKKVDANARAMEAAITRQSEFQREAVNIALIEKIEKSFDAN